MDEQCVAMQQLIEENKQLRMALRDSPSRELQIAGALRVLIDELTLIGPRAAARTMTWVMDRYMTTGPTFYAHQFVDRRTKKAETQPIVEPPPAPLTEREQRGAQLREKRIAAGLSQNKLGRHVGLRQTDISNIERGLVPVSGERWALLWKAVEV